MQTPIVWVIHRTGAGSGVHGPLGVVRQVVDKHILGAGTAGVAADHHHVGSVLRHVGLIHEVDGRVFAELTDAGGSHGGAADGAFHQGITVGVVEDAGVAGIPQKPSVVGSWHIGTGDHDIARQVGDKMTVPTIGEHQVAVVGIEGGNRSVAVGEGQVKRARPGILGGIRDARDGAAKAGVDIALPLRRRHERAPIRRYVVGGISGNAANWRAVGGGLRHAAATQRNGCGRVAGVASHRDAAAGAPRRGRRKRNTHCGGLTRRQCGIGVDSAGRVSCA